MKKILYLNNGGLANGYLLLLCMCSGWNRISRLSSANSRATIFNKFSNGVYDETFLKFNKSGQLVKIEQYPENTIENITNNFIRNGIDPTYFDFLNGILDYEKYKKYFSSKVGWENNEDFYDSWRGISDEFYRQKILDSDCITRFFPQAWGYDFTRELSQERHVIYATKPIKKMLVKYVNTSWAEKHTLPDNIDLSFYLMHDYPKNREPLFKRLDEWIWGQKSLRIELEDHNINHLIVNPETVDWGIFGLDRNKGVLSPYQEQNPAEIWSDSDRTYELMDTIIEEYLEDRKLDGDSLV